MIRKRLAIAASILLIASLQIAAQVVPAAQKIVKTPHVEAELIARYQSFLPGQPIEVALRLSIIKHWHTYWRNPGDSGLPTKLKWTLPAGFTASEIQWPHPKKLPLGPLMNYGYEGEVLHLVTIKSPANVKPGDSATFTAKAEWLVCADVCIPEEGVLTVSLLAVASTPLPTVRWANAFSVAEAALPSATLSNVDAKIDGLVLQLNVKTNALGSGNDITFYPHRDDVVANAAKQIFTKTADGFKLDVTLATPRNDELKTLDGIFVANNTPWGAPINARAVTIAAPVTYGAGVENNKNSNTGGLIQAKLPETTQPALSLLTALLFAFLGGLVLNLMPCVFPVLGIKVMGFVENAHGNAQLLRRQGAAFFVGVTLSFLLLAGLMLALRAAGQSVGWGFQLQEPLFVAALAILFFAMALNLSGVFEIGTSLQSAAGNAELKANKAQKNPLGGALASGVLATVVATPCMAPGLGASVGFTLGQTAPIALLVFMAIAVGLALPVVLLAFFPALLRYLPKPGAWMETFKQFMAFPLYATVVWLVWVLGSQTGNDGVMQLLVGLTLIALAAWLYGRWQVAKPLVSALAGAAIAAIGIAAAWAGATTIVPTQASGESVSADGWTPYSAEKIAQLRGEGKAVFVDFTATWCITCQVNKRVALNQESVIKKMNEANVTRMKADWTRKDAAITAALASFGRNGVPLYVLYPAKGEVMILPEVLTPSIVITAIENLTPQK